MALHLTAAGSLEPLAEGLVALLAQPLADPFAPECIVVPGEGVKAWLRTHLARRLGVGVRGDDGIVANIEYPFPAEVVRRALGPDLPLGAWSTGRLLWPVLEVLQERPDEFGQHPDALRARAIADLFDRYTLHRPRMVVQWSKGVDVDGVGAALPDHHRWQPALWRAVQLHLSADPASPLPTDAELMLERTEALRTGAHQVVGTPGLPERVVLFGLAGLPAPHLHALAALSTQLDVHVFAPTPSARRWAHVRDELVTPLKLPVPRTEPTVPVGAGQALVTSWGRASRESHILLLDAAAQVPSVITAPSTDDTGEVPTTALARLQHAIRSDVPSPEEPALLDPADPTLRLHRAHGPARQVEILRDALLHLLDETDADGAPLVQPRDIAVLCADLPTFAPLLEATFAGDPARGVPRLPVALADRSIRQQSPLLDTACALLDLLDGRFRVGQVLEFAARAPVRLRFGLDTSALGRIDQWACDTNVHWGLDAADQARFDLPADLRSHTWQAGIDQLLIGSTMSAAGPRLTELGVAPFPDLEGTDVAIAGSLADLLHALRRATDVLSTDATVHDWCGHLLESLRSLCATSADDAWMWRETERVIEAFRAEACIDDRPRTTVVDAADLAALLRVRLESGAGRPRFGSGSVTVSSLTAQRGVPFPVVCLLGLDTDLGAGAVAAAEDLIAATPCIGDRDARGEQRAQLLDAVLSAGERLLVFSTGRDVRTNQRLSPAVALAELTDAVDALMVGPDGSAASEVLSTDHPRQAWSDVAFIPGELGVATAWSFDRGALEAAIARRGRPTARRLLREPLPPPDPEPVVSLEALRSVAADPARTLLRDRLGISVLESSDAPVDTIPLELDRLAEWSLADTLLAARLPTSAAESSSPSSSADWTDVVRARGAVPPGRFGTDVLASVQDRVDGLLAVLEVGLAGRVFEPATVAVRFEPATAAGLEIEGNVAGVCDDLIVTVTASRVHADHLLAAVIDLAALSIHDPARSFAALLIGRAETGETISARRITLTGPEAAQEILAIILDLRRRALVDAVPAFPRVTRALLDGGRKAAAGAWMSHGGFGDRTRTWAHLLPEFDVEFDELAALECRPDEIGSDGSVTGRLEHWAHRIWDPLDELVLIETIGGAETGGDADLPGAGDESGSDR